ncbi:MAG TPA: ornithine cyclodeaminase family protein [Candidatus Binatia bacterium]|nr:ornithine cyclodeaminase family protein [Candidatus Binatia bacterium]
MALFLNHEDVCASVTMLDAVDAMEGAFREQAEGKVTQPHRLNLKAGKGWLRVGPAVLEGSGYMGFKAMNLAPGHGVRYQVHLYRIADGELLAIMDALHLTTLRTGATSAVATRRLAGGGAMTVGVIGSGIEARAQLEAMHALGLVRSARVYSPTQANREKFAADYSRSLGIEVLPVDRAKEAVSGCGLVVAAVKSTETALLGEWLEPGTHVNSVGTARPEQREIDPATFQRSAVIVVDTREGVFGEAGDVIAAKGIVLPEQVYELAELVTGRAPARCDDQQITLFKSVGSAHQDVAIAGRIFERAREKNLGSEIDGFPIKKIS